MAFVNPANVPVVNDVIQRRRLAVPVLERRVDDDEIMVAGHAPKIVDDATGHRLPVHLVGAAIAVVLAARVHRA